MCPLIAHHTAGFTLAELAVTVALSGVTLAFAVPSMSRLVADYRASVTTKDLVAALALARAGAGAVTRGAPVKLCAGPAQPPCPAGHGWRSGWHAVDSSGQILRVWPGVELEIGHTEEIADSLTYGPSGFALLDAPATFTLHGCSQGIDGRRIRVAPAGYVRTSRVSCEGTAE